MTFAVLAVAASFLAGFVLMWVRHWHTLRRHVLKIHRRRRSARIDRRLRFQTNATTRRLLTLITQEGTTRSSVLRPRPAAGRCGMADAWGAEGQRLVERTPREIAS